MTASGTATTPTAVTGGIAGLDFSIVAGGTCNAGISYNVGDQCTVNVRFAPLYPGQRAGAVLLKTSGGTLIGSGLVTGTASGALPVFTPGRIDTAAGNGQFTYGGDGGPAASAAIQTPHGVLVDAAGNLILSDSGNNRIRRVDAQSGNISTIVGSGVSGFSGDSGPATQASIASPSGLALDGAGNLYFADTQNDVIRRVDALTQIVTTIAGTPHTSGYTGDGGTPTAATFNLPMGLAFDNAGMLLVADSGNHTIRRIDLVNQVITTIAGTGSLGYNGDNILATSAQLYGPSGVLVLPDGTMLIADSGNNRVRRVGTGGIITTIAGTGQGTFTGDNGPASAATLYYPLALSTDPVGNLYIADASNNRIRFIDASTGNITTIVGTDARTSSGDGGPANLASIYGPSAITFTQAGDIYLTDMFNMRIRHVSGSVQKFTYATIRRGKVSPPQLQTLANYGTTALQLATPAFVYSQLDSSTTTCSTTASLAPSATCVLGVEFAPTVIGNDVMGSVTLPSNAPNVTPVIDVDGQVLDVNPTSVAVTSSANPSVVGGQVVFTATVTSDDTGRTGNMTFTADGNTLCSLALGANGTATCATSSLTLGSHSIVVQYAGDAQNASATSPTLTQVVKQQANIALASSVNPSVISNAVTFTATLTAPTGTPSGTVTFFDGTTNLGSGTLSSGSAMLTVSTLAVGSHAITVQYSGDTQNAPSTSAALTQTVQKSTTTTTLATSNANVPVGTAITLTATVASTNGPSPTGTVTFAEGANVYGTATMSMSGVATVTFSNLAPGTHVLVATYSGDTNSNTSASTGLTETVQQIGTTTALTSDSNPLSAGATLHLTAQVTMANGATADGPINGQVVFADGGTPLGSVQLNGSLVATLSVPNLGVGTHGLTATYQGNTNYSGSVGTLTEVVVQTATNATLSSTSNPTLAGLPASFQTTVTSSTGVPSGTVSLNDGNTVVATATLSGIGSAAFSLTTLTVGSHTLTVHYNGSASYLPTTSAPITQTVNLATVSVTLTGPSTPVNMTAPATLSGSVGSPGVTPTGTLSLREGAATLATQPVGAQYGFTISTLPAGTHTLTVAYSGDGNNAAAQSSPFTVTVQLAPTATTLSTSGSPSVLGSAVTFTAATTSVIGNLTGSITFLDGSTVLATVPLTNGGATLTTTGLTFGVHQISATYNGDVNHASSTSAGVAESIVQQASLTLTSSLNPSNSGQPVVFTAALPTIAGATPTGNVTFAADGVPLLTVALDATGTGRMQTSALSVGTHAITASYTGDNNFTTASGSLTEVVRNASTSTSFTVSADPATFGAPLTLVATVLSNGGTATGAVTFTENGVAVVGATLNANGTASVTFTTLSPGRHTLVANYVGDGKASPSVSTAVSFLVRQKTMLALASTVNPSFTLSPITFTATLVNSGAAVASGSIVFTEGSTTLGTVTLDANGQATLVLPPLSVGTHTIAATYAGDDGDFPAAAPTLQQTVQQRGTTTGLTSSATNAADAQQVTLIAVVGTPTLAAGTPPTGTVTFTSGATILGIVPIDSTGVATLTIRLASSQSETLVGTYSGDASYSGSTSSKVPISSGPASQFTLTVDNMTLNMPTGNHTTVNLAVSSIKGFNDTLKFGCLGLPFAATCTFSTPDTKLASNGTNTLQLTIDTGNPLGAGTGTGNTAYLTPAARNGAVLCLLPAAALLFCFRKRRWMPTLLALALASVATLGSIGCGGLVNSSTPPGTYTFQVTALGQGTGANEAQTITLTVTK